MLCRMLFVLKRKIYDELDSRKRAIFENFLATMINKSGLPLYYFSNGCEHLEIDFVVESCDGIILLEEKTVNGKMAASRTVMNGKTNYKASMCYKVTRNNFGVGDFFTIVPQYAFPFLLDNIYADLKKGTNFDKLVYPSM